MAQGYVTATAAGGGGISQQTAEARLDISGPGVLAVDADGNLFVTVRDGVFRIDGAGAQTRVAGTEKAWRYGGDGGPAILARLNPRAVAIDAAGNLILADTGNHRIRRLDAATGIITTVAGDGVRGFSGDGGPAVNAQLDGPSGVAVDAVGNLYIADGTIDGHDRIRRVERATGVISTVAGNGSQGYSGDGGPATLAQFHSLGELAVDSSGSLYIADNFNRRVRMVSGSTGIITTVAGTGVAGGGGDGGFATGAELNNPLSLAVDAAGNLYIADAGNFRIRKVTAATGRISTLAGSGKAVYPDTQHGYPCAVAVDAEGNLYVADLGASRVRKVPADVASRNATVAEVAATPSLRPRASGGGFKINVTFDPSVPAAAQTAFNGIVSAYENVFTSNNTVNVNLSFGNTGLGESETEFTIVPYSSWRAAMMANAAANPSNIYAAAAAQSLPASDPIGMGDVFITTADARTLGFAANVTVDTNITLSNSVTYEYTGKATPGAYDFMDVAAHELDEGLGIGSMLTGLSNNAAIPSDYYEPEDYFRYSAAGTRDITTNPNAVVYFSYDGGTTNVAQFNQAYSALGDGDLDRNDWIYGNYGCPVATPHIQDAITCSGQAVPVGQFGSPEVTVLSALGYNSAAFLVNQVLSGNILGSAVYYYGDPPIAITTTASSGLPLSFSSSTPAVCTVSGITVTIVGVGACTLTAAQPGNAVFAPLSVTQSFTVMPGTQQIDFPAPPYVNVAVATLTMTATASSGLPVSYSSTTPAVCRVSGSTVTVVGAGTCTIIASQAGNGYWAAASPVTRNFIVGPGSQTIAFPAPGTVELGVGPFALSATASSGLPVSFSSVTPAVCTVAGITVTIVAVGTCSITANQAGNANYIAAPSVTQSFTVGAGGPPAIKAGGVVPIYSSATNIQPGSWVSIFGSNLADETVTWNNNFPTMLGGTSVTINGKSAYLWYVSPTQINLQAPDDNAVGGVNVVVTTASGNATSTVTLAAISPSFSLLDGKHVAGIILRSGEAYDILGPTGTSFGYPTVAARAGDTIALFGVGFGPTDASVAAGQLYSGAAATTNTVLLKIGGTSVTPSFAGLSSAGLYQINVTIPAGLGAGDQSLVAIVGGAETQSGVLISLQ
jgi:uncharacterized protein (TIGR03437 family)